MISYLSLHLSLVMFITGFCVFSVLLVVLSTLPPPSPSLPLSLTHALPLAPPLPLAGPAPLPSILPSGSASFLSSLPLLLFGILRPRLPNAVITLSP